MYCIVLIGPAGDDDLLRQPASWPLVEGHARGPRQHSRQAAGKDRDLNKGDEEDVCNTRTKSRTSRWSNTTHEEAHDANDK